MEGTDISTGHAELNRNNDHTLYGNGCPNIWTADVPYNNGSTVACSTRLVATYQNEMQKNGTYYDFQAAATGSGGTSLSTDNTNSPDSFCPLGWQMPYGGTGGDYYDKSKSWKYLYEEYGQPNDASQQSYPIDLIKSGNYSWLAAVLFAQSKTGIYQTITTFNGNQMYRFVIGTNFDMRENTKLDGYAVRCVNNISVPSSTARWKEHRQI